MEKEISVFNFEKEYLLLHEILNTLRNTGLSITGTQEVGKGMMPIYEFQLGTAFLHFSVLVALLNNSDAIKKKEPLNINSLRELQITKEEVEITKYQWEEVARACDTLNGTEDIKKDVEGGFMEASKKTISLTNKGLLNLYSKTYLKQYQQIRKENIISESTISTNRLSKIVGIVAIIFGIASFVLSYLQYKKADEITNVDFQRLIQTIQQVQKPQHPTPSAPLLQPDSLPVKKRISSH